MKQGKFEVKRVKNSKLLVSLVALALIVGIAAGGTIAWLIDQTEPVKNTFTSSNIGITLTESENLDLTMIPGHTITKDPKVTVAANSESCYVFVKLEKSNNYGTYLAEYTMAEGWTALEGVSGVYYRTVSKSEAAQDFAVLKDNQVTVKDTVTKEQMSSLTEATYPTLTITAYACQQHKDSGTTFTAAEAWQNCQPTNG